VLTECEESLNFFGGYGGGRVQKRQKIDIVNFLAYSYIYELR